MPSGSRVLRSRVLVARVCFFLGVSVYVCRTGMLYIRHTVCDIYVACGVHVLINECTNVLTHVPRCAQRLSPREMAVNGESAFGRQRKARRGAAAHQ